MCNELADELEKLVEIYACMKDVSSGDLKRDEGLLEMADIVISDLRCLIEDAKSRPRGRPDVPIGFKLHAVRH